MTDGAESCKPFFDNHLGIKIKSKSIECSGSEELTINLKRPLPPELAHHHLRAIVMSKTQRDLAKRLVEDGEVNADGEPVLRDDETGAEVAVRPEFVVVGVIKPVPQLYRMDSNVPLHPVRCGDQYIVLRGEEFLPPNPPPSPVSVVSDDRVDRAEVVGFRPDHLGSEHGVIGAGVGPLAAYPPNFDPDIEVELSLVAPIVPGNYTSGWQEDAVQEVPVDRVEVVSDRELRVHISEPLTEVTIGLAVFASISVFDVVCDDSMTPVAIVEPAYVEYVTLCVWYSLWCGCVYAHTVLVLLLQPTLHPGQLLLRRCLAVPNPPLYGTWSASSTRCSCVGSRLSVHLPLPSLPHPAEALGPLLVVALGLPLVDGLGRLSMVCWRWTRTTWMATLRHDTMTKTQSSMQLERTSPPATQMTTSLAPTMMAMTTMTTTMGCHPRLPAMYVAVDVTVDVTSTPRRRRWMLCWPTPTTLQPVPHGASRRTELASLQGVRSSQLAVTTRTLRLVVRHVMTATMKAQGQTVVNLRRTTVLSWTRARTRRCWMIPEPCETA